MLFYWKFNKDLNNGLDCSEFAKQNSYDTESWRTTIKMKMHVYIILQNIWNLFLASKVDQDPQLWIYSFWYVLEYPLLIHKINRISKHPNRKEKSDDPLKYSLCLFKDVKFGRWTTAAMGLFHCGMQIFTPNSRISCAYTGNDHFINAKIWKCVIHVRLIKCELFALLLIYLNI